MIWIVWQRLHVHDPSRVRAFLVEGDDALDPWRMSNSQLQPNVLKTIQVLNEDAGKTLDELIAMPRYAQEIDAEVVRPLAKPKLSLDEQRRLGVDAEGRPVIGKGD